MFKRKKKDGGSSKELPQLTQIELTKKNLPLRITLLVLALVIAIGAFWYGFSSLVDSPPGWNEIKCASGEMNCSREFILNYYLGDAGISASAENKKLSTLYTELAENGYRLFNNEYEREDLHNIRYVNQHPNEDIVVGPALYKALSVIVGAQNRAIFLAPVYAEYKNLFLCQSDAEALIYDPTQDPELAAYVAEVTKFVTDPQMVNLQLLGDYRLRLEVAPEYLEFARENEIEIFLDFAWMTNAFIADYMADALIENGFTNGYLTSYDGYVRNLYKGEETFSLNLFHREGKDVFMPAVLQYSGGNSVVTLRDFPMNMGDSWRYYTYEDGRIVTTMLEPSTAAAKSTVSAMTCYSQQKSCSEILMEMMSVYFGDSLDVAALNSLKTQQIYTVYAQGKKVCTNDSVDSLKLVPEQNYTKEAY